MYASSLLLGLQWEPVCVVIFSCSQESLWSGTGYCGTAFGWTPAKLGWLKGVSSGQQGVGGKAHGVSKECTCLLAG